MKGQDDVGLKSKAQERRVIVKDEREILKFYWKTSKVSSLPKLKEKSKTGLKLFFKISSLDVSLLLVGQIKFLSLWYLEIVEVSLRCEARLMSAHVCALVGTK